MFIAELYTIILQRRGEDLIIILIKYKQKL